MKTGVTRTSLRLRTMKRMTIMTMTRNLKRIWQGTATVMKNPTTSMN
jgi:hypothetical protein